MSASDTSKRQIVFVTYSDALFNAIESHSLIAEGKLLKLYSAALPDRPEGGRLPKRIPLYDMRRFLPHHPNSIVIVIYFHIIH